jgi:hypothetical protein
MTLRNPEIRTWASRVVDYSPTPDAAGDNADPSKAIGPVGTTTGGQTVSLGDLDADQIAAGVPAGSITLEFDNTFRDGPGWDFAVFENAFRFSAPDDDKVFAELAYVEVSTDGTNFVRFPSVSLTTELFEPFGPSFAGLDPSDVHNLAGKHESLIGTPLDLGELSARAEVTEGLVDLDRIRYVRLVDIPGDGSFLDGQPSPAGILDAWPTTSDFGSGGLDLDAVGARYAVPEPGGAAGLVLALLILGAARRGRMSRTHDSHACGR